MSAASGEDSTATDFIAKWRGVNASELSTSQSFLIDLCHLHEVPAPHPTPEQDYMFERPISFSHGDGSTSAGRIDLYRRGAFEAYRRYAIEANQGTTNLATFRAIAKKYPHKQPEEILRDLVSSTPGAEGKWFAAAKDAGLFNVAIELATRSPTDPRTLTRAARDYAEKQPAFALGAGLAALRWISLGHGYEITGTDVLDAYSAVTQAAVNAVVPTQQVNEQIRDMLASTQPGNSLMKTILARHLAN